MIDPFDPDWTALRLPRATGEPQTSANGLSLVTDLGPLRVEAVAEGVLRLRLGEPGGPDYGILQACPKAPAAVVSTDDGWRVGCAGAALRLVTDPLRLVLERGGEPLLVSATDRHFVRPHRLPPLARSDAGWFAAFALQSGEPVYGFGEKWGSLDGRGQFIRSWTEDALGVNSAKAYKNCPFAWSPRGWGVFVHTPARVHHGVGHSAWSHRTYALEVADSGLDLFLIAAASPVAVLERYTALTGRTPQPPRWSLGVWLSRAYYRTADELLNAAGEVRARGIPCDVITLDGRAWLDTRTRFAFEWDAGRYPDPKAVTDRLHELDLRLCCWEYPLVSVHHPLFAEMAAKGWLLRASDGEAYRYRWDPEPFGEVLTPLPESGIVDFTHPDAYAYWGERHNDLFDAGVDVIKTDFGEQVAEECVAANGDSGARLHNAYPLLYNRCVFEATARRFGQGVVLARAGWAGSQRYPAQWGGDPQADWEGLAASLRGGLSWGLSGVPCYAHDIGGFYGPQPDPELFVRWTQAAVFCSHIRFHGIGHREPWAFGAQAEAIVRDWLRLRYRLLPYLEATLAEAGATGLPVMRAMVLIYPDDPAAWGFDTQWLFGRDLLVAAILRPGGAVTVYLPHGRWRDFYDGEAFDGGRTLTRRYPLERFPLFVRDGTALALGPAARHTGELEGRPTLDELRVYGVPDGQGAVGQPQLRWTRAGDGWDVAGTAPAVRLVTHGVTVRRADDRLEVRPSAQR